MDKFLAHTLCIKILLSTLICVTKSTCPYLNGIIDYSGVYSGTTLPKHSFIDCPKNATSIIMAGNAINVLFNDTFEDFYQLKSIDLSDNNITDIPDGLLYFHRELQSIDLSGNEIGELKNDVFIDNLSLRFVYLQNNKISYIGNNVLHKDLTMIEIFNISYNQMTYFEPWVLIPQTPINDDIDFIFEMQHNMVSKFTNTMNYTYDLQFPYEFEINLQFNHIENITRDMFSLYHKNFEGSLLSEMMTYKVNFTGNQFVCDCFMYELVHDTHDSVFYYYKVQDFKYLCNKPNDHHGIDLLHDLPLEAFVCNVSAKCPSGCFCQERPYTSELFVDCSYNNLYELPDELPEPRYGTITLKLDGNHIRAFTNKKYTSKLGNVSLSYNDLNYIEPEALTEMNKVNQPQYLDVSHNSLKYLPKAIKIFSSFDKIRISGNNFVCDCNMTWLTDWINLSPNAPDIGVKCTAENGDRFQISKVTDDLLRCSYEDIAIAVSVSLGIVSAIIIGIVITAKRCPYETKVILYRIFRIHPQDKYRVDREENKSHDIYFSYETDNFQARQWLKTVFLRKLEKKQKRKYKVFIPEKDALPGQTYADELINSMRNSRRIIFLLTEGFLDNEWNIFEAYQSEMEHNASDNLHGRVLYILWNNDIREKIKDEPWRSRMDGKRVLCPDEKLFWSKILYELPVKT